MITLRISAIANLRKTALNDRSFINSEYCTIKHQTHWDLSLENIVTTGHSVQYKNQLNTALNNITWHPVRLGLIIATTAPSSVIIKNSVASDLAATVLVVTFGPSRWRQRWRSMPRDEADGAVVVGSGGLVWLLCALSVIVYGHLHVLYFTYVRAALRHSDTRTEKVRFCEQSRPGAWVFSECSHVRNACVNVVTAKFHMCVLRTYIHTIIMHNCLSIQARRRTWNAAWLV